MKTIQVKTLFIVLLLSTAAPSLLARPRPVDRGLLTQDLLTAAYQEDLTGVKRALKSGAVIDSSFPTWEGEIPRRWTALMIAAASGYLEIVNFLLGKGANVESGNKNGVTALMFAAENKHLAVVRSLLQGGADTSVRDLDEDRALEYAEQGGNAEIIRLLEQRTRD